MTTRQTKTEIRLTLLEKKILQKKAENAGLTLSEFLRRAGLSRRIGSRLTPEELACKDSLKKIASSFANITNLLHDKDSRFYNEVQNIVIRTKEILKRFE